MKKPSDLPSLEKLGEAIERFHDKDALSRARKAPNQGAAFAMRLGLEMVAGVMVGAGAGILIDKWLGTLPIFMVICLLLGAAGGFLTLYRTASALSKTEENDSITERKETDERQSP